MVKQKFNLPAFFKKYGWILLLAIIVVTVVTIQVIPKVQAAATDDEFMTQWTNFLSGFSTTIFDKMTEAYTTLTNFATGDDFGAAPKVQEVIVGLAHVFVVLFMLIGIIKEGSRGEVDVDMIYWFRIFASTAVAVVMVSSITVVMDGIYRVGDYLVNQVSKEQTEDDWYSGELESESTGRPSFENENEQNTMIAVLKNIPGFEYLGTIVEKEGAGESGENYLPEQNLYQYLKMFMYVAYLPMLVALFLMYSGIFEIKVRQMLAPLAVSTIAYEGARGSGVRFLKKYFACFLKIVIYFLVAWVGYCLSMYFYGRMINSSGVDTSNLESKGSVDLSAPGVMDAIMMLLSNIVCAMAMMQTGGIADEVIGA